MLWCAARRVSCSPITTPRHAPPAARGAAHVTAETDDLLERLHDEPDPQEAQRLRDLVVVLNLGLVDGVAARYRGRGLEWDDLVQVGRLALCKAVAGYRPGRGPGFSAYAVPTISGEIKRHFRDHAWGLRPPRRLQELQHELRCYEGELGQQLAHTPTRAELASALHVDPGVVTEIQVAGRVASLVSLDAPSDGDPSHPLSDRLAAAGDPISRVDTRETLRPYVHRLDPRSRQILHLRFVENRTQDQIGQTLGISQMQVCRLLGAILHRLRDELDEPLGEAVQPRNGPRASSVAVWGG